MTDVWIVDTNVVVAGLLTEDAESPPARVLDAMLSGQLRFLLCVELLAEYRKVLLRPRVQKRHGLGETDVDLIIDRLATHAVVVDIESRDESAPDIGDDHLWRMLATTPESGLIAGDSALLANPPRGRVVIAPREWLEQRVR